MSKRGAEDLGHSPQGKQLGSRQARPRLTARAVHGVLICLAVALSILIAPSASFATAKHNAILVHVGPSGLEAYNAWTRTSTTLVRGMTGSWYYPVLSPHGLSVVTIAAGRSDRAYGEAMFAAVLAPKAVPFELTLAGAGMTAFEGWLDDYTAVFQQPDPSNPNLLSTVQIARNTRTASWRYYDGAIRYPATARKRSAADKTCSISVSQTQVMTIRVRKTKKLVARFKVPGSGNGSSPTGWHYADASISPDGKFVAYELWRMQGTSSRMTWRTSVCTIAGKKARRIKNDNGGFVWR